MIREFADILKEICLGRVAFLGIGNSDRCDDGAGMTLAALLTDLGVKTVFSGGMTPEKILPTIRDQQFDTILFLDATETGNKPGSVVLLKAEEIVSQFPQVSTHKLSLGTLAKIVCDGSPAKVWLLGIQPESVHLGPSGLSNQVFKTIELLAEQIADVMNASLVVPQEQICK